MEGEVMERAKIKELQLKLKAAGFNPGAADGILGPRTVAALRDFESSRGLSVDGVPDGEVLGLLDMAAEVVDNGSLSLSPQVSLGVPDDMMAAWRDLVAFVLASGVVYASGRGRWDKDRGAFLVSNRDGLRRPLMVDGRQVHGFVCTTWVNFALGFLTRRGDLYTPTGGMPPLWDLVSRSIDPPTEYSGITYRGYGENCRRLWSTLPHVRPQQIVEATASGVELPRFLAVAQSTTRPNSDTVTKWWHHVAMWWRDPADEQWRRIAADGSHGRKTLIDVEVMRRGGDALAQHNARTLLRVWGVVDLDKPSLLEEPIPKVELE